MSLCLTVLRLVVSPSWSQPNAAGVKSGQIMVTSGAEVEVVFARESSEVLADLMEVVLEHLLGFDLDTLFSSTPDAVDPEFPDLLVFAVGSDGSKRRLDSNISVWMLQDGDRLLVAPPDQMDGIKMFFVTIL